jgi:peptide chain release factor subunit 1
VVSALRNVIGKLRLYKNKSPESGLAIFAGVTADSGHKDYKLESYVFEPVEPISRKLYVCDNRFHVDHLIDHLVEKDIFALLAIDSAKATIATLKGDQVEILKTTRSGAAKKHKKGGQSSARYARLREEAISRFLKRVTDDMKQFFLEDPDFELKGVIIGGPGQIKNQITEHFDNRLKKKIVGIKDLGYGGDRSGINELVTESFDVLEGVAIMEEKRFVRQFLDALMSEKANYGEKEVRQNLLMGAVDTVLVSRGITLVRVKAKCQSCNHIEEKTLKSNEISTYISEIQKQQCQQCSSVKWEIEQKDLIIDLGELAEKSGAKIEIINSQTEEGRQILNFGGICAILRYSAVKTTF